MSISQYLDLAYATLADDSMRRGLGLIETLDGLKKYAAGSEPSRDPAPASGNTYVAQPSERSVVEMNNASLATLEAVMGGLNFG